MRALTNAFDFQGFVPLYIRPLFCEGMGPFRWVALSGDPQDIARTDAKARELFPEKKDLIRWLDHASKRIQFQGLPARICWLGYGERHRLGLAFNEMVRKGELKAPIVIGRDHLDAGSVASPYRETESMQRRHRCGGRLAAAQRAAQHGERRILGELPSRWRRRHGLFTARRRSHRRRWLAHAREAALRRVLTNDPGTGVMRHADAGYERAIDVARQRGVDLPMLE